MVIYYGSLFLRMNGPFFLAACVNQIFGGALRGAGKTSLTMVNMLFSFVLFRQAYLFIVTHYISNTPVTVGIGYPVGWIMCAILMLVSYFVVFPKPNSETESLSA
jgi:Na+-driven multidrug efflux pump